jgi:hypothetical protein
LSYTLVWTNDRDIFAQESLSGPIDLSKATKLKDLSLVSILDPGWITSTLRTITRDHGNLQRFTIDVSEVLEVLDVGDPNPTGPRDILGETVYERWLELDRFLAQLLKSHPICLEFLCPSFASIDEEDARILVSRLLPGITGRMG